MIFEKDNVSFQILDVFYYIAGEKDSYNPKHAFDNLSFKIKCNAKYTFNKNTETLTDHSIAYVPGSIISDCQNKYNESIAIHLKVHNYSTDRVEKFIPPDYSKYEKLFRELLECWTRKTGPYKYDSSAILNNIFSEFNKDSRPEINQSSKISNAIQYIEENIFNENLSLATAAKESSISDVYFRKLFFKEYKMSPKKYVINKRMEYASSLIVMGYHSLQQISEMCGYSDYKHFSVEFKKHFGLSPTKYYYPPHKRK